MNADVLAHWRHADRFLASASALVEIGDPDSAASRAYYAAFHAVSALFAHEGQMFRKHEAVESAVHRDLVRAGRVPITFGEDYADLRQLRMRGDYAAGLPVDEAAARAGIERARRIVDSVRALLPATLF